MPLHPSLRLPRPRNRSFRPQVEWLEDRRLLSSVLLVDDNRAEAPNAQYTSISAAVAAARPGDTIRVFAGTYHESVTIPKTLTLRAESRGGAVIVDPGAAGSGFDVQANDVKIVGFTIQDAVGSPGINLSRSFSGYDIENNILRDNSFGIYLNSSGAHRTLIAGNQFLHNNAAGSASGNGIYSDQGVSNAVIARNFFTGQENAAMIFVGNGTTAQAQFNLRIDHNFLRDDAAIILVNTSNSRIEDNVSIRSNGSGIFFGGGVHDVVVAHNTLRNGAFTGINLRTDTANYPVTTPNTNNIIRGNVVTGFGDSGIRLREGAANNLVAGNFVADNGMNNDATTGDGISLEAAVNNVIRDNRVLRNRRDGIRVDAASHDNRIINNRLRDNGEFDARDDSTGTLTAGTANTWQGNSGETENRPGLLSRRVRHDHGHDHDRDDDDDDRDPDRNNHGHGRDCDD